jgi:Icc-related predicted phosphoesterase
LVLGGDMTGKMLVPVERTSSGWHARFSDHEYTDMTEAELHEFEARVRATGQYVVKGDRDELSELMDDEAKLDRAFRSAVADSVSEWMDLADARLRGRGVRLFVAPGNDDFLEIDDLLLGSDVVEFVEGRVVTMDGHEVMTTGYSNPTPWDTPRELPEPALRERLDEMFSRVTDPANLVVVAHAPPFGSGLDNAPEIDQEFRVQSEAGSPRLIPVGSTAVRDFIEEHQPLLGLHGHVHDSQASRMIGRTLCLNPGSSYDDGSLVGALVTVSDQKVESHQFVWG